MMFVKKEGSQTAICPSSYSDDSTSRKEASPTRLNHAEGHCKISRLPPHNRYVYIAVA